MFKIIADGILYQFYVRDLCTTFERRRADGHDAKIVCSYFRYNVLRMLEFCLLCQSRAAQIGRFYGPLDMIPANKENPQDYLDYDTVFVIDASESKGSVRLLFMSGGKPKAYWVNHLDLNGFEHVFDRLIAVPAPTQKTVDKKPKKK